MMDEFGDIDLGLDEGMSLPDDGLGDGVDGALPDLGSLDLDGLEGDAGLQASGTEDSGLQETFYIEYEELIWWPDPIDEGEPQTAGVLGALSMGGTVVRGARALKTMEGARNAAGEVGRFGKKIAAKVGNLRSRLEPSVATREEPAPDTK